MSHLLLRGRKAKAAVLVAGVIAAIAGPGQSSSAATLNSTVQPGDVFFTNNNLNTLSQVRSGARVGGTVSFGVTDQLGGIFSDSAGNLYLAENNSTLTAPTLERVSLGQSTSTVVLSSTDFSGASGTVLREATISPTGVIYTLYTNGAIDKFTPSGGVGAYTRSAVGTLTGFTSADRGSGHQLSLSADGNYLITGSRTQNKLWSINTNTGAQNTWTTPTGNGPASGTQLTLSAESVLDPVRNNKVLVPMGLDGLYEVDFDPLTGTFPTSAPLRLSNDTNSNTAFFLDGLAFDTNGNLYLSNRDTSTNGSLRGFTEAELVAAEGGSTFTIQSRAAIYSGTDVRVARDLAVILPEPAMAGLLTALAAAGLLARRRGRAVPTVPTVPTR